ncbi:hypothetical protein F8M41_021629 [Gigaspora margarita]|uniref:Uncharacterized protein n=1 Tax=Gigaspora margarita TaxID=4874 RepID=A0A8H4B1E8_GIGMA|nr:hypothetical protein F8M41_021629 [Gigaspora margarita]
MLVQAHNNCMTNFSETLEQMDEGLRNMLLHPVPIEERQHLIPMIKALRKVHKFDKLYESYLDLPCRDLSDDPKDLADEVRDLFLIKNTSQLKYLVDYRRKLLKFYSFKRMLPSYFHLPPPKPHLPAILQGLNLATRQLFLCDPKNSMDFRYYINILRKHYMFRRIPSDYFKQKLRLPEKPENICINQKYKFLFSDKDIAKQFIAEIQKRFRFTIPLSKKYMDVNLTDKLELSQSVNKIS